MNQISFVVLLASMLTSCSAGMVTGPVDSQEVVAKMASARWALMIDGKAKDAYLEYVSPASKTVITLEKYLGSVKLGIWKSAEVSKVVCDSETLCKVSVALRYGYQIKGGSWIENVAPVSEVWRSDGGRWWYVPDS